MTYTARDIVKSLELLAPIALQESYDNSGFQVGDPNQIVSSALLTLDVTEHVLDEAISKKINLIIAHHPLIFSGLKRIIGDNFVERIVQKAIKHDITIYAIHTNLDNVKQGVNSKIAEKLGLNKLKILAPVSQSLYKLVFFVPVQSTNVVIDALFAAGAGEIGNYSECSFSSHGIGTFKPGAGTKPTIGRTNGPRERVEENRVEVLVPKHLKSKIFNALIQNHPYEEVAHEWYVIDNILQDVGAGMIGEFEKPISVETFLKLTKQSLKAEVIKYTPCKRSDIKTVAICGGSGSFLLNHAKRSGADALITSDFKYHQFFDSENDILIADIGHYETEQFTSELLYDYLKEKFPNFALYLTHVVTNPIKYYY